MLRLQERRPLGQFFFVCVGHSTLFPSIAFSRQDPKIIGSDGGRAAESVIRRCSAHAQNTRLKYILLCHLKQSVATSSSSSSSSPSSPTESGTATTTETHCLLASGLVHQPGAARGCLRAHCDGIFMKCWRVLIPMEEIHSKVSL